MSDSKSGPGSKSDSGNAGYRIDGLQQVVDLLNASDPAMRERLLSDLRARDPQLVQSIQERLVRFEDVVRLSPNSRRELFLALPRDLWELALRKTESSVMESILSCLPLRTQEELREAIALSTQKKLSEVQEAQRKIAEHLRAGLDQNRYHFSDSVRE